MNARKKIAETKHGQPGVNLQRPTLVMWWGTVCLTGFRV